MVPSIKESNGAVTFEVRVVPRANRSEVVGLEGEAVKIRLQAPPVDGKANAALIKFLAGLLNVGQAQVEILAGHSARTKVVRVRGIRAQQLHAVLGVRD